MRVLALLVVMGCSASGEGEMPVGGGGSSQGGEPGPVAAGRGGSSPSGAGSGTASGGTASTAGGANRAGASSGVGGSPVHPECVTSAPQAGVRCTVALQICGARLTYTTSDGQLFPCEDGASTDLAKCNGAIAAASQHCSPVVVGCNDIAAQCVSQLTSCATCNASACSWLDPAADCAAACYAQTSTGERFAFECATGQAEAIAKAMAACQNACG